MSGAASPLDSILLEDIAKNCPSEFLSFHECMGRKDADPQHCALQQYNLANCIKKSVPAFQRIQNICAGKLQAYEACLRMSGKKSACEQDLASLRQCASGSLQ
ncbi:hypothetical protein CAAN1_01S08240 [[Candida] anglica]|uniref:IMS import disulfide relay-system CHCH-CHCH-like Cx9C domain-containing protein n=1 Tax=[Candida] anglica TaxID=148631 RepID=A0ABP0EJZ9_9ASCO